MRLTPGRARSPSAPQRGGGLQTAVSSNGELEFAAPLSFRIRRESLRSGGNRQPRAGTARGRRRHERRRRFRVCPWGRKASGTAANPPLRQKDRPPRLRKADGGGKGEKGIELPALRPRRRPERREDLDGAGDGGGPCDRLEQGRLDRRKELPDALQDAQPGEGEPVGSKTGPTIVPPVFSFSADRNQPPICSMSYRRPESRRQPPDAVPGGQLEEKRRLSRNLCAPPASFASNAAMW